MTKYVEIKFTYRVEIPDTLIQEMLESYRETIKTSATEDDLFAKITWADIRDYGDFVDGIGSIREQKIMCEEIDMEWAVNETNTN